MELLTWLPLSAACRDLPALPGIYVIRHTVSGKEYVGLSRNVKKRASGHRVANKPRSLLHRAINAHGIEEFEICLAEMPSLEDLSAAEVRVIAERSSVTPLGYNQTAGGGRADVWKRDPERKAELAERNSRLHKGRKRSDITRARLSAAQKGRKDRPEVVAARVVRQLGSTMPNVTRKAINAVIQQKIWMWPPDCMVPLEFDSVNELLAWTGRARSGLYLILSGKGAARDGTVFAYVEERKGGKAGRKPK